MISFLLENYSRPGLELAAQHVTIPHFTQPLHSHNFIEIMLVSEGSGVCIINGKSYPMIRGDFYIMNLHDCHEFIAEKNFSYYQIMFKTSLFSEPVLNKLNEFSHFSHWLKNEPDFRKKYIFASPCYEKLEESASEIVRELKNRTIGFELKVQSCFLMFLIYALRHLNLTEPLSETGHNLQISRVLNHIHRHYQEKLTIQKLARTAMVSPNYLGELFHKETGLSVFEYLCRFRIEKARNELETSNLPLSQLALSLGFCDLSYFSRSFRRYTGITPLAYRKLLRSREQH